MKNVFTIALILSIVSTVSCTKEDYTIKQTTTSQPPKNAVAMPNTINEEQVNVQIPTLQNNVTEVTQPQVIKPELTQITTHDNSQTPKPKCTVINPNISEIFGGICKNGFAQGKGNASGIDYYSGEFNKGMMHGKGLYIWNGGNKYEGQFLNDKKHGKGVYFDAKEGTASIVTYEHDNLIHQSSKSKVNQQSINAQEQQTPDEVDSLSELLKQRLLRNR